MKRTLLLTVFILVHAFAMGQTILSIRPDQANHGQTLRTYITTQSYGLACPPLSYQDVYLQQGGFTIYTDNSYDPYVNIYQGCNPWIPWCDSMFADFYIPPGYPMGYYDLHLIMQPPFGPQDEVLTNAFFVGIAAGTTEGTVYFDINQNGARDGGEPGMMNQRVQITPGNLQVLTNSAGNYHSYLAAGSMSASWIPQAPYSQTSSPASYSHTIPPSYTGDDFGLYAPGVAYSQYVGHVSTGMRCNTVGHSYLYITNSGFLTENGSITLIHSPNLPFDSSTVSGYSISGDTVRWTYSNLQPGSSLSMTFYYSVPAAGSTIFYNIIDSVFDQSGNFQNVYNRPHSRIVSCAWDPNDKQVNPPGEQAPHYTLMGEWLEYQIRFQNTGNDTAFTVIVYDTLDVNLDLTTFEVLAASHPMNTQFTSDGKIQFVFEDILLPDSVVDEPNSHGFILYRLKALAGIPDPTVVTNRAGIVFDFNPPVMTNTTMNTLVTSIPVSVGGPDPGLAIGLYPNPAKGEFTLFNGSDASEPLNIRVFNISGQEVLSARIAGGNNRFDTRDWNDGLYLVRVESGNGSTVYSSKLVLLK